ncbi:MAG: hypothetical protein WCD76_04855, partial [Pyrinomonadaceae bacterium]
MKTMLTFICCVVLAALALTTMHSSAATPTSGTLTQSSGTLTYTAGPFLVANPSSNIPGNSQPQCNATTMPCDDYNLTVNLSGATQAFLDTHKVEVTVTWPNANADFDLYVLKGTLLKTSSATSSDPEVATFTPEAGTNVYKLRVAPFAPIGQSFTANVRFIQLATPTPTPTPLPTPTPPAQSLVGLPRFFNYATPAGIADDAGEPSIGSNWKSERIFSNSNGPIPNGGTTTYFGGFMPYMLRAIFDDCASPANVSWEQAPLTIANAPRVFGDPILFTDHETGRTFVSQELGLSPGGSTTEFTDDDGHTFSPSQGSGAPSGVDHQTIGGGPFAAPLTGGTAVYKNSLYYCSQSIADAVCAISLDGGRTFGPSVPMYTAADCTGLHGHIKIGPDGTAYVPNRGCGGSAPYHDDGVQTLIVSENNGATWALRPVTGATTESDDDPSVGVATDGTIYFGYQAADGHARISVSHNKGQTWSQPYDVGAQVGVQNMTFPEVVAGDPDRATFAFYGTTTGGSDYDQPGFNGIWYLYIASTFDGGQTWTTQNVTPNDPVQRGGICGDGDCRNQLDFFDITVDKEGRVLVGWDDGCIGGCVQNPPNSFSSKAVITRQSGGKRMFAAYDPVEPVRPGAPSISGSVSAGNTAVSLSWPVPDNGGSAITGYKVYRRAGPTGAFAPIATVTTNSYTDTTYNRTVQNYYHVTAINAIGEGPYCRDFTPSSGPAPSACDAPGILVNNDVNTDGTDSDSGQNTPADSRLNIKQLYVGEPYFGAGVNKLVFTLQMAASTTNAAPPQGEWYMIWNRLQPDADFDRYYVAMRSDATGAVTYEYGKFGVPLDTSGNGVPNPNSNVPVKIGDVDAGAYNPLTGEIKITLSTSKAENIQPGQSLNGLNVRTFVGRPDQTTRGPRNQTIASDITGDGTYTLAGNASCRPNQPPT